MLDFVRNREATAQRDVVIHDEERRKVCIVGDCLH